jgi:RHS repeat-associated protein
MGQVATVTDAESRVTAYGYNVLGQRISTTYSDSGQQTIDSFDAAGRPLTITKPTGRKHHLAYNFLGNVTQIQFKNAAGTVTETQTMTYDAYGRETGVASSQYNASTAKSYNDLGQLATEATTYSGQTYTVSYAYDAQGRLNQMTYPSNKQAAYTYDSRQQLKTISWQSTQVEDRSYNDIGRLAGVDRAFVDETRSYNTAGRVTTINSNNVGSMTYSYDANENVTGETLSGNMANYSFSTVSGGNSGYDGEDRFMRFIRAGVSEDTQLTRTHIGNISNVNLNGGNTARGYNNAHGLTTVTGAVTQTYDSDGNTTKLHTDVTGSWDDAGRMRNTNTPNGATAGIPGFNEYGYVGGLRIWKKITRSGSVVAHRVYIHAGPNVIAEYNVGVAASTPVQEYVYADQIDSLVLIHRSNGTKYGVSRNRQWSVVALHDLSNGNVVERYAYEMTGKRTIYAANGTTVRTTSSYGNNFGYTNRWHDEESGLMYFRTRYYNPLTGEFLSRDPMEFVDGLSLYRGYFAERAAVDPFGNDWVWPWDKRASWDPGTTIGTWVAGAEYATVGGANWVLAGDSNASEEELNAAAEGWIRGFGINPFDTTQSLGQLVYTDQLGAESVVIQAAIGASQIKVREEWDCYKSCMWDVNRIIPYVFGGFGGTIPYIPTPKFITWPFLPKSSYLFYTGTTKWAMNYSHLLAILKENKLIRDPAYERWRAYQEHWKRWQKIEDTKLRRLQLTKQFGCKILKGMFAAEMLISTYCSWTCYFRDRDE